MRLRYLSVVVTSFLIFLPRIASADEPSVAAYRKALKSTYWPDRYRAVEALGKICNAEALEVLLATLKDKEPYVRLRAVLSLSDYWSASRDLEENLTFQVDELLRDKNPPKAKMEATRRARADARAWADRAATAIRSALKDSKDFVREAAVEELAKIAKPRPPRERPPARAKRYPSLNPIPSGPGFDWLWDACETITRSCVWGFRQLHASRLFN